MNIYITYKMVYYPLYAQNANIIYLNNGEIAILYLYKHYTALGVSCLYNVCTGYAISTRLLYALNGGFIIS